MHWTIAPDCISQRIEVLARAIQAAAPQGAVLLCVLNGALPFFSLLLRCFTLDYASLVEYDVIKIRSYVGRESSREITVEYMPPRREDDKPLWVVEDIVDTGHTAAALSGLLPPFSLVTLLNKPARRTHPVEMDLVGFEIEDIFVVGFGLDFEGRYRALPGIASLEDVS